MLLTEFQSLSDEIKIIIVNFYYKTNNYNEIVNSACKLKTISEVNKKMHTLCSEKLQTLKTLKNSMDLRRVTLKEKYKNIEVLHLAIMGNEYDPLFEQDLKDIAIVMPKQMNTFFFIPGYNHYLPIITVASLHEVIPIFTIEYLLQQGANYNYHNCLSHDNASLYEIIHTNPEHIKNIAEGREKEIKALFKKYICRSFISPKEVTHIHRTVIKSITANQFYDANGLRQVTF